jgi:Winged helix DNA-binding domain
MNIGRLRLANQHVARPVFDDPAEVVHWLGAVQAQDYLGGLWALGLRTRRATEASVEAAIARRAIVRTWPMRGTLHFVAAADVRWMCTLLTPRVLAGARSRWRQLEIDDAVFARTAKVTETALAGGKVLRRDALYGVWSSAGIATHDSRGLHILGYLAQTGLLCFGPRDGKQQTFTLLEEWLPPGRPLERDIALGELARRYFSSHGPATIHDFAWWSGLTVTEARAGLEAVKSELESEDVGERTFWFRDSTPRRASGLAAYLLPPWDEFTVAYRDRSDILAPRYATRVNAGGGVLSPVIIIRGEVVGTWRRTIVKGAVTVRASWFRRIDRADRAAIDAAAGRYARFLGLEAGVVR